jgi:dolichol-phosphate mannosyltransferase
MPDRPSTARPSPPIALGIVVPTYNEAASVVPLLDALRSSVTAVAGLETTVLFVDDNSPDGTAKIIEEQRSEREPSELDIRILHRPRKEGLGKALVDGLTLLLDEGTFDYLLLMDADLSHQPRYIPELLRAAADAELVVGSRYIDGGATPDWAWYRRVLSRGGNRYARLFLGSTITDYTGGFNLFSTDLLRRVELSSLQSSGYGFEIELKYRALRLASGVRQVPIVFVDRRAGESKIPRNTILKNLLLVPRIRATTRGAGGPAGR